MSNRISQIEPLVNNYVNCWKKYRRVYDDGSLYEDNDFGCENDQIFRNRLDVKAFTHDELSSLAWLLTRELRGQINHDHKIFWSWCGSLVYHYASNSQISLFEDSEWTNVFVNLINLLLTAQRNPHAGPEMLH